MKSFKRGGLHRLDCPACAGYTYATVANLETVGVPSCACGRRFEPLEWELAELLAIDCPALDAYRATVESVWRGQEAHGHRLDRTLQDPHTLASARMYVARTDSARRRRLGALKPATDPIPF